MGFDFERVLIRRQRSRWGSCSTRGTISLNCCLMFQRPQVVRYLMIHELSHPYLEREDIEQALRYAASLLKS